jgi:hypothetical protein
MLPSGWRLWAWALAGVLPVRGLAATLPESAQECVQCHPAVVREWTDSLHRHSGPTNPWFRSARERSPSTADCDTCHTPGPSPDSGVGCQVCHVPNTTAPPVAPNTGASQTAHGGVWFAPGPGCGACHTPDHPTPQSWTAGQAPTLLPLPTLAKGECVTCHMVAVPRQPIPESPPEPATTYPGRITEDAPTVGLRTGRSHRFAGTHRSAAPSVVQRGEVERMTNEVADLRVTALDRNPDHIDVRVLLVTDRTPHPLPAGPESDLRNYLEVTLTSPAGDPLRPPLRLGVGTPNSSLPPLQPGIPREVQLRVEGPLDDLEGATLTVSLRRRDRDADQDERVCKPPVADGLDPCPPQRRGPSRPARTDLDHSPGPRLVGSIGAQSSSTLLASDSQTLSETPSTTELWARRAIDAALRHGDTTRAAKLLDQVPVDSTETRLLHARAALQAGNLPRASALVAELESFAGPSVTTHALHAMIAEARHDLAASAAHFQDAAVLDPTNLAVLDGWARAEGMAGNTHRSIQVADTLHELGEDNFRTDGLRRGTIPLRATESCLVDATTCPPPVRLTVPRPTPPR